MNNLIKIDFTNYIKVADILSIYDGSAVSLKPKVKQWCVEAGIWVFAEFIWHRNEYSHWEGPGHFELYFQNNESASAFCLKWA